MAKFCIGVLLQWLANASKDVNASIDNFNCQAAHAQRAVSNIARNKFVVLKERLQTFSQRQAATLSSIVDKSACDAFTSLQGYVAHCQSTVQMGSGRLAGQDGVQSGSGAQGGFYLGSVDPDSGVKDSVAVRMWYCSVKKW